MSAFRLTFAEFQRIRERAWRASHVFGQTACQRIADAGAKVGPWPLCDEAMAKAARREYVRLEAAHEQHEAAIRDVPTAWLTDHELWRLG